MAGRTVMCEVQVFVANPNKTQAIIDILAGNKDKLLRYLKDFHNETSALVHSAPWLPWHARLVA